MLKAEHIIPGIAELTEAVTDHKELDRILDRIQTLVQDVEDASYEQGFNAAIYQTGSGTKVQKARDAREKYSKEKDKAIIEIDMLLDKISFRK